MPISRIKATIKQALGRLVRRFEKPWKPNPGDWQLSASEQGLALHGVALQPLVEEYGSPLHVVDVAKLESNAKAVIDARSAAGARAQFLCSYKTNPIPGVLERLHACGAGADVVSEFELWLALRLQVPPQSIVYNGPVKSAESLQIAIEAGVACINANSLAELQRIADIAQGLDKPVNVGLRVALQGGWDGQFGLPQHSQALDQAVELARDHSHLNLIGLHVHRGHWIRSKDELIAHVQALMDVREQLQTAHLVSFSVVDLGGSLACPTVDSNRGLRFRLNRTFLMELPPPPPAITPAEYARIALDTVAECAGNHAAPEVILEPGRGITGNTQIMLCTVADIKPSTQGFDYVIVDAGIHNAESMCNENHAIFPLQSRSGSDTQRYRLTGPLCTPADVLRNSITLPRLQIGDRLAIMDSGAYFVPFSSSFSYPRPGVVALDGDLISPLTARETFSDVIARDRVKNE